MDQKTRIVIADDETVIRDYLAVILQEEPGFEVVGFARNGQEAVDLVRRTAPDLVLLELRMPVKDGLTAAREIRSLRPELRIAVLTGSTDEESAFAALELGVDGYLLKHSGREEILAALQGVAAGEVRIAGATLKSVIEEFSRMRGSALITSEPPDALSEREKQALRCLVKGLSNKEIARLLGLQISTVKSHLHSAFEKLGVQDRTQAALLATRKGWFSKDP